MGDGRHLDDWSFARTARSGVSIPGFGLGYSASFYRCLFGSQRKRLCQVTGDPVQYINRVGQRLRRDIPAVLRI